MACRKDLTRVLSCVGRAQRQVSRRCARTAAAALADAKVAARIEGKSVAKVIVVPGKLVNIVVK